VECGGRGVVEGGRPLEDGFVLWASTGNRVGQTSGGDVELSECRCSMSWAEAKAGGRMREAGERAAVE